MNPIRNDTHQEYSVSQGIARGDAVLPNAQAGVGLRSSAPTLQNLQTENLSLRAGHGEDTSIQNNGGLITSAIRDFCTFTRKQNETQNARIIQHDDQISQQNDAQDARMCQQNKSQNNMMSYSDHKCCSREHRLCQPMYKWYQGTAVKSNWVNSEFTHAV